MTISAKASQAAAAYLSELSVEYAPPVVDEFREQVIDLTAHPADRTGALFALIENHDLSNEPRTMKAYMAALRAAPHGEVRKSETEGGNDSFNGVPLVVFGAMIAAAQAEGADPGGSASAPAMPIGPAGASPAPPASVQSQPAPAFEPAKAGDARVSYVQRAVHALRHLWRS